MARRPISLADRLRAVALLNPSDEQTAALLLDMMRPRESRGTVSQAAYRAEPWHPKAQSVGSADWLLAGGRPPEKTPTITPKPIPSSPADATLVTQLPRRPIPASAPGLPSGLSGAGSAPARAPLPLIEFRRARAILTTLAATPAPEGSIDTSALLGRISRGLPLRRLDRLSVWTVRRGLQLLVDRSTAMTPLIDDVESVERRLKLILGGDRLKRLNFNSCPSRGVRAVGGRSDWKRWEAPAGVAVVMLTDLGCVGPGSNEDWAGPEEWARFADLARDAGSALVALAPYPARRVPSTITRRITVVPWCEDLSAARLRRILGDARTNR